LPLTAWQLNNLEPLIPEERLWNRLSSQGHLSTIAARLESSFRIGDIFKKQPKLGLHIVVQLVPSRECERLSIRRHRVSTISQPQFHQVRPSHPTSPLTVSHLIVLAVPLKFCSSPCYPASSTGEHPPAGESIHLRFFRLVSGSPSPPF
jgi:hypothetical protein